MAGKISPRHRQDIAKISPRYRQDIAEILSRHPSDIPKMGKTKSPAPGQDFSGKRKKGRALVTIIHEIEHKQPCAFLVFMSSFT